MPVTVVLSGIPGNIPLETLADGLDYFLQTDEVSSFHIRYLPKDPRNRKTRVALDFESGYDAMVAQELLDGHSFLPDDSDHFYTISAKVTDKTELKRDPRSKMLCPEVIAEDAISPSNMATRHLDERCRYLKKQAQCVRRERELINEKLLLNKAKQKMKQSYLKAKRKHKSRKRKRSSSSSRSRASSDTSRGSTPQRYKDREIRPSRSRKRKRSSSSSTSRSRSRASSHTSRSSTPQPRHKETRPSRPPDSPVAGPSTAPANLALLPYFNKSCWDSSSDSPDHGQDKGTSNAEIKSTKSKKSKKRKRDRSSDHHSSKRRRSRSHSPSQEYLFDPHDRHGRRSNSHDRHGRRSNSRDRHGRRSNSHDRHGRRPDSHDRHGRRSNSHDRHGRRPDSHDRHGRRSNSHDRHGRRPDSHDRHGRRPDSHDRHGRCADSYDRHGSRSDSEDSCREIYPPELRLLMPANTQLHRYHGRIYRSDPTQSGNRMVRVSYEEIYVCRLKKNLVPVSSLIQPARPPRATVTEILEEGEVADDDEDQASPDPTPLGIWNQPPHRQTTDLVPPRATEDLSPLRTTRDQSPPEATTNQSPLRETKNLSLLKATKDPKVARHRSPPRPTRDRSPPRETKSRSSPKATKDLSPSKATRHRSPQRATKGRTPTRTTRWGSPSTSTRVRSPQKATRHRSPPRATKGRTPPRSSKWGSPTKATRGRSPLKATKGRSSSKATRVPSPRRSNSDVTPVRVKREPKSPPPAATNKDRSSSRANKDRSPRRPGRGLTPVRVKKEPTSQTDRNPSLPPPPPVIPAHSWFDTRQESKSDQTTVPALNVQIKRERSASPDSPRHDSPTPELRRINVTLVSVPENKKEISNTEPGKSKTGKVKKKMPLPLPDTDVTVKTETTEEENQDVNEPQSLPTSEKVEHVFDIKDSVKKEKDDIKIIEWKPNIPKNPTFYIPVHKLLRRFNTHTCHLDRVTRNKCNVVLRKILRLRIKKLMEGITTYMAFRDIREMYRDKYLLDEDVELAERVVKDIKQGLLDDLYDSETEEEGIGAGGDDGSDFKVFKKKEEDELKVEGYLKKAEADIIVPDGSIDLTSIIGVADADVEVVERKEEVIDISDSEVDSVPKPASSSRVHNEDIFDLDNENSSSNDIIFTNIKNEVSETAEDNKTDEKVVVKEIILDYKDIKDSINEDKNKPLAVIKEENIDVKDLIKSDNKEPLPNVKEEKIEAEEGIKTSSTENPPSDDTVKENNKNEENVETKYFKSEVKLEVVFKTELAPDNKDEMVANNEVKYSITHDNDQTNYSPCLELFNSNKDNIHDNVDQIMEKLDEILQDTSRDEQSVNETPNNNNDADVNGKKDNEDTNIPVVENVPVKAEVAEEPEESIEIISNFIDFTAPIEILD